MAAPIVEEVRQAREEHAKKLDYDLEAVFLQMREAKRKRCFCVLSRQTYQACG